VPRAEKETYLVHRLELHTDDPKALHELLETLVPQVVGRLLRCISLLSDGVEVGCTLHELLLSSGVLLEDGEIEIRASDAFWGKQVSEGTQSSRWMLTFQRRDLGLQQLDVETGNLLLCPLMEDILGFGSFPLDFLVLLVVTATQGSVHRLRDGRWYSLIDVVELKVTELVAPVHDGVLRFIEQLLLSSKVLLELELKTNDHQYYLTMKRRLDSPLAS
jgi:hypothetical protein